MERKQHKKPGAEEALARLLTIDEVCHIVGISRSTFHKWRADGHGPQFRRLPNGQIRIRQEWLESWLDLLPEGALR